MSHDWPDFEIHRMDCSLSAIVPDREPGRLAEVGSVVDLCIFDETALDLSTYPKTAVLTIDEARALGMWLLQTADKFKP